MGYGTNQHTMIFSGVAANNRCTAIRAGTIGAQHLAMQRILQIHQLGLVKLEISHTILNYKKNKKPMVAHSACRQKVKTESNKNSGRKVCLVLRRKLAKKPQNNKSAVQ